MHEVMSGTRTEPAPSSNAHGRRWLTLAQLLELLPLKRSRIYYLTHTRQMPFHKIGKTLLFDLAEIQDWLQRNGNGNGSGLSD